MEITKINNTEITKLFRALEKHTRSFIKRGVSIVVIAQSGKVAMIDIEVNGTKGIGRKQIIITFDNKEEEWIATTDGYEYRMVALSDVKLLMKNKINKLAVLLSKF